MVPRHIEVAVVAVPGDVGGAPRRVTDFEGHLRPLTNALDGTSSRIMTDSKQRLERAVIMHTVSWVLRNHAITLCLLAAHAVITLTEVAVVKCRCLKCDKALPALRNADCYQRFRVQWRPPLRRAPRAA